MQTTMGVTKNRTMSSKCQSTWFVAVYSNNIPSSQASITICLLIPSPTPNPSPCTHIPLTLVSSLSSPPHTRMHTPHGTYSLLHTAELSPFPFVYNPPLPSPLFEKVHLVIQLQCVLFCEQYQGQIQGWGESSLQYNSCNLLTFLYYLRDSKLVA